MANRVYREDMLRFQPANRKMAPLVSVVREHGYHDIRLFGLPSGPLNSCPFALECAASAVPVDTNGHMLARERWSGVASGDDPVEHKWMIVNGDEQQFRCYAASEEVIFKGLRRIVWHNFTLLKNLTKGMQTQLHAQWMADLIYESLKSDGSWDNGTVIRVHPNGEFFSRAYLQAWLMAAQASPRNRYYAYTKAIQWYVLEREAEHVPSNFSFTMSRGGRQDTLIDAYNLKESIVVGSEAEAAALGLEVDHDDSHALFGTESFALIIHGVGNKGFTSVKPTLVLELAAD